jgi:hypothetical protein
MRGQMHARPTHRRDGNFWCGSPQGLTRPLDVTSA